MVVLGEDRVNVVFHGKAASAFAVVPVEVDSRVKITLPVFCDVVVFFDGVSKMDGMLFANIFNAEVVYNESEHDGAPFVAPKTRGAFALVVAFLCKAFGK